MSKELNNALNDCLERLLTQDETIEQCLQSYPEHTAELKPLLETAMATRKALDIQPRADFKARAKYQFRSALEEAASQKSRPSFSWLPRWATVVTMALGLLLTGGGTVAAAGDSMPDSPLYPVKMATEQVQLKLTLSTIGKAELEAKLIDKRVVEIIYLANKGDAKRIETVTQHLDKRLATLASLASAQKTVKAPKVMAPALAPAPSEETETLVAPEEARGSGRDVPTVMNNQAKLRAAVTRAAANHPAALRAALEKAPESAKPALLRAIAASETGYKKALKALD